MIAMKIQVISTINGYENEGMRNIATHLSRSLENGHEVLYSSLKNLGSIAMGAAKCDLTIVCTRLNARTYSLVRFARIWSKRLAILVVQEPQQEYVEKAKRKRLACCYFVIDPADATSLRAIDGAKICRLAVGIDVQKFKPVSPSETTRLKINYGFPADKPLVVHVGHCSAGRGLEDFRWVDSDRYSTMVVASGMFESQRTVSALHAAGVRVHSGYLPAVNEIYQMADCYLFPTQSREHVISIPLSVMEALACGTPVVAYESFRGIDSIAVTQQDALLRVGEPSHISAAVQAAVKRKSEHSYLKEPMTWDQVAQDFMRQIMEEQP